MIFDPTHKMVLVTGGGGFLGGHIVHALINASARVRVLDVVSAPDKTPDGVEWVTGSILDETVLSAAMGGVDAVIHAAAIAHLWQANPARFQEVNATGTERVLKAAEKAGVARFVHISSEVVFSPRRGNGGACLTNTETLPPRRQMAGPYAYSKWDADMAVRASVLKPIRIYPTAILGPGDRNNTPPNAMLRAFAAGKIPAVYDSVLNMVDVRDAADGTLGALTHGANGAGYFLGGENVLLSKLLGRFGELIGRDAPSTWVPYPLAFMMASYAEAAARFKRKQPMASMEGVRLARHGLQVSSERATADFGYKPRGLDETLQDIAAELMPSQSRSNG